MTLAFAFEIVKWDKCNANYFGHQLDDYNAAMTAPFALELYCKGGTTYACLAADDDTIEFLVRGIYSWFQGVEVSTVEDHTLELENAAVSVGTDLQLASSDIYPLQSWRDFKFNSMQMVYSCLSRFPLCDNAIVQVLCRPIRDSTMSNIKLRGQRNFDRMMRPFRPSSWFKPDAVAKAQKLVDQKCLSKMYWVNCRVAVWCDKDSFVDEHDRTPAKARVAHHLRSIVNGIKLLNATDENKFEMRRNISGSKLATKVRERRFDRPFKLSTLELASLWHPPDQGNLPNTAIVLSRKGPPPRAVPGTINDPQVSFFGHTNFRDQTVPFGIRRFDRRRHLYALGKSGNGKSCLLQLLIKGDIDAGFGCAVLDPHGDLVDDILKLVPKHRTKDVVLFDPSDVSHPPCFNPMEPMRPDLKMRVTLSFLETFKRVLGGRWSDKMDHILRYAMIALLNIPGSSIVSLRRILSDEEFRDEVVRRCPDDSVRRFWDVEYKARRSEFDEGPVSQLLNRLDELLATDLLRNILGQPQNLFDFRDFMDNRKIVLIKMPKGLLGAQNAALLGSLVIWKVYEAAMSRADIPAEQRQDFYFYIDEFQNFATDSFGEILSESRKYRLCLTFANQFLGQLPGSVQETVFGNVASLLCFRTGASDADKVSNEFKPRFAANDLLNLPLREFYVKMSIDGEVQEAFSGRTLDLIFPHEVEATIKECLQSSRSKYALPLKQAQEQLALSEIMSLRLIEQKLAQGTGPRR
jgi:hypothetical protein